MNSEETSRKSRCSLVLSVLVLFLSAAWFAYGCAAKPAKPLSPMDDPIHHYRTGMALYDQGQPAEAAKEFDRALQLKPDFSPALAGQALVLAAGQKYDQARGLAEKAAGQAETKEEKVLARTAMIRVMTAWKNKDWLDQAEAAFETAKVVDPQASEPYFFMAQAYEQAKQYDQAANLYKKVVSLKSRYAREADEGWDRIQKIKRAEVGEAFVQKIAQNPQITRADAAALLVNELELNKLAVKNDPVKSHATSDYAAHPLKEDIQTVLRLGLRGFEEYSPGVFKPDAPLTRSQFAQTMEDLLIKFTGDKTIARRYIGSPSPFNDISGSHYAFNAVMTCVSRGWLPPKGDGSFGKDQPVSGAEALLAVRKLKTSLGK